MLTDWILGGGMIGLVGLMLKNNNDTEQKINRAYKRLDEVKDSVEQKFTPVKVCEVLHKQIDAKLTEISTDIKVLLRNNGHG